MNHYERGVNDMAEKVGQILKDRSKGGKHAKDNIICACSSCNSRKNDKLPNVFASEIGLLLI